MSEKFIGENPERNQDYEPIELKIQDEIGTFSVEENSDGAVILEITNASGKKITLNEMMPPDWEIVGNKRIWEDDNFMGLANTDTSVVMHDPNAIVISESELNRDGWRFVLIFLHELGHVMRHIENPHLRDEANEAYTHSQRFPKDVNIFKESEKLIAHDERDAWAFAIRKFRWLVQKLNLPKEKFFESAEELRDWIFQFSLGLKAKEVSKGYQMQQLDISEEDKKQLIEEIFQMYSRKKSS